MLLPIVLLISWVHVGKSQMAAGYWDKGICYCSVNTSNSIFPVDRIEALEASNTKLNLACEREITKVQSFSNKTDMYLKRLNDLTKRVELAEKKGASLTELDFEPIRTEIAELESLVLELKSSLGGSNENLDAIHSEVKDIIIKVSQLEKYDQHNVLEVRRKISSLQKRLEDCKNDQGPSVAEFGTCQHGKIKSISKPIVVQRNSRGSSITMAGGWGKDSFFGSTSDQYWVCSLDDWYIYRVQVYANNFDLLLYKQSVEKSLSRTGNGAGMIVYNGSLVYNCLNTRDICRMNMNTNQFDSKTNPNAAFQNRFSYAGTQGQDFDLAADEYGLWLLHTSEKNEGNMIIAQLNSSSLDVLRTWNTTLYKPMVSNAFMVCGVMYAARTHNAKQDEIFYMYDTNTNSEAYLNIVVEKVSETISHMSYNPNDRKLYVFSGGYHVEHKVTFDSPSEYKSLMMLSQ